VRLLDLLEPIGRLFIIRVLVRMMYDSQFPVRLFDLGLRGILLDSEDFVVVFPLALLQFQLRASDILGQAGFLRVGFVKGLQFPNSLVPVSRLS